MRISNAPRCATGKPAGGCTEGAPSPARLEGRGGCFGSGRSEREPFVFHQTAEAENDLPAAALDRLSGLPFIPEKPLQRGQQEGAEAAPRPVGLFDRVSLQ